MFHVKYPSHSKAGYLSFRADASAARFARNEQPAAPLAKPAAEA